MRRFYQSEWQGISFADFTKPSSTDLAGAEFYNRFYRELFRRCGGYEELDVAWRQEKSALAEWIAGRLPAGSRVLSVGCGLGYVEHRLQKLRGEELELHVQDCASDALAWIRKELPGERVHLSPANDLAAPKGCYDLVYLSAVDYALSDPEMTSLLEVLQRQLRDKGSCLLISASLEEGPEGSIGKVKRATKDMAKYVMEKSGLYHRGQFWGWTRSRSEYRRLMRAAGYVAVEDGFIETLNQRTYFIEGKAISRGRGQLRNSE